MLENGQLNMLNCATLDHVDKSRGRLDSVVTFIDSSRKLTFLRATHISFCNSISCGLHDRNYGTLQ